MPRAEIEGEYRTILSERKGVKKARDTTITKRLPRILEAFFGLS